MSVDFEPFMSCCLWPLLRERAASVGDVDFFSFGGESFTYSGMEAGVARVGVGLRGLGLGRGERLAIFAENSSDVLLAWLGANAAGIVDVPINLEARGDFLRYLLGDARPHAIVATGERLLTLAGLTDMLPGIAIVLDDQIDTVAAAGGYRRVVPFSALRNTDATPDDLPVAEHRTGDIATIMYTSGTTGPSKGVMLPHGYYAAFGALIADRYQLTSADRLYGAQPLYHIDARMTVISALCTEGAVTLGRRFSASRFWEEIRECGATRLIYIGTMVWILYKQDPKPDDANQPAHIGLGSSTPWEILNAFEERFNTQLIEAYGMTEAVLITCNTLNDRRHGSVGKPTPAVELQIVNPDDHPVPPGEEGEITFRPRYPNVIMQGYWNQPTATTEIWRNLWFHTGDLAHQDPDGFVYYHGRGKDSIRRRGENISAWEVEQALTLHPEILEAAAFGVPSPLGEEDVAALCVTKPGSTLTHPALHTFVSQDLPTFAVPRYIEFVQTLPKTPSERIAKAQVRERGLTPQAWDATANQATKA